MKVISRSAVFAIIIALTLVSFSVTSVFAAAPATGSKIQNHDLGLQAKWKNELTTLQRYKFLDGQIAKWVSVWLRIDRSYHAMSRKNTYTNEVQLDLQQAELIATKHAGFDEKMNVINQSQAIQSVKNLSFYLDKMHVVFFSKFRYLHKLHHRFHKH